MNLMKKGIASAQVDVLSLHIYIRSNTMCHKDMTFKGGLWLHGMMNVWLLGGANGLFVQLLADRNTPGVWKPQRRRRGSFSAASVEVLIGVIGSPYEVKRRSDDENDKDDLM